MTFTKLNTSAHWLAIVLVSFFVYEMASAQPSPPAEVSVETAKDVLIPTDPKASSSKNRLDIPASLNAPAFDTPPAPNQKAVSSSERYHKVRWDLRALWNELRSNNPQLVAARESYLSAKATVPQIAAPANPQVGLIWSGMPPGAPFALGTAGKLNPADTSYSGYSFSQPFLFPGKKSLASEIADTSAEALRSQNENLYLQLGSQLAGLYYATLAAQKQLTILSENVVRTELIKNIAKARYANNAAAYVEFLNAQVAQSAAEADRFNLEKQLAVAIKNINTLIGRDPREKLILEGDVGSAVRKVPTLIELETYAEGAHPLLTSTALQVEAAKKGLSLANKAYLPDFQVVATSYTPRGPLTNNNGTAYYQFEFDIVIPLYFFTKEKYGVVQAARNQAAAEATNIANRQQIILGVGAAYAAYEQAKKQAEFLRERQVPQAEAAYKVALTQYATNGVGFNNLLTAQTQFRALEIQLAIAESVLLQTQAALFASSGKDPIE
jgi:outer membrane protein TolC